MADCFEDVSSVVPFGWRKSEDGILVKDESEQLVLDRIQKCRDAGVSEHRIAGILMGVGYGR